MHFKTKNSQKIKSSNPQSAFTIVELLVVIVIIGILATIVIIFYIGTHDKAIDSSLQADLKGASTVLELDKANGDLYPTTKENANDGKGLKSSNGTTLDYAYSSGDNSYCLTATKEGRSYYINSEGRVPVQGGCPVGNVGSFTRTWGGADTDYAYTLIQTSDGGYAVAGITKSFGAGNYDAFIAKYTANGDLSWSRTWGGANEDGIISLIQTSDGGYAVAGNTTSYGADGFDVFISKYTTDGTLSWSKTWGGTGYDYALSLVQTSDGGYAVAGNTGSYGTGLNDAFIAKYTADGTLSWSKTWGGVSEDYALSLVQTSDGGYAVAGNTGSYGDGNYDAFIAKYTADGTLSWSRTWGGANYDNALSLIQTSDGGYAVAGNTGSYGTDGFDAFIAKYTADGTLSWSRTWGGANDDKIKSLIQTSDGGYAVAGNTDSYGAGLDDAFMAKYAADGALSWSRTWGGTNHDYAFSLIQISDGGYAVVGRTDSYGAGLDDAFIAKYTADGLIDSCPLSICQSPTATTTSPTATTTSPTAVVTSPVPTTTNPTANSTNAIPIPPPPMTITFSSQELYVAYPGVSTTTCKEWTAPNGKQIKGFLVSQATESGYDFFTVSLDGVEKYKKSGSLTDQYIDTSFAPGTTLKACTSTDSSTQEGYGGQVTGVVYN